MQYEGNIFRPPSEAASLILQATIGCSYNKCTFCAMYRDTAFRIRPMNEIAEDIETARKYYGSGVRKIFLADGDALIMRTAHLEKIAACLEEHFPRLQRISVYATPQALLLKKPEEFEHLKSLKYANVYLGVESGSDTVLELLKKGVTQEEMIEAGRKAVRAGLKLSTMIILGAGGPDLAHEHAVESAKVLNAINPRFISTLTMMVIPGTPLHEWLDQGKYIPPTPRQCVEELKDLIVNLDVRGSIFRANHVSNMVSPAGTLPKDKKRMVREIEGVLAGPIPDEFGSRGY